MVVAVSAERFRAVCYPLSKRHVSSYLYKLFAYLYELLFYFTISLDVPQQPTKQLILSFQSPYKYVFVVFFTSFILKLPRFFQFKLVTTNDGEIDYWTTAIMEDPVYLRFSSYWDDLFSTGFLPLAILTFFNVRIYSKVKKFYLQII